MKILRLLNKKNFLSILFILCFGFHSFADDQPVDIWNVDKNKTKNDVNSTDVKIEQNIEVEETTVSEIYKMQSQKENQIIKLDESLNTKEVQIIGLFDPEDNGLDLNMWSNSDGDQLKNIFNKINKINLSKDASEIMEISLLTNAYYPNRNISEKEFLRFKSEWLIKNSDFNLIEEYLIKNQIFNAHPELVKHLVDEYLSESNVNKACDVFSKNLKPLSDEYLSKFNIYCLIHLKKIEEAQLNYDLKKELGFQDKYFENKINYLLGYSSKIDLTVSEKTILDFHLAHKINPEFSFEPKDTTNKIIWKYLSSSNLLNSSQKIDISELDKISILEKATHNKNYPEKDLFEIYKKFQFNITQLLNADQSYKSLSNIEARALIYQKILLESEMVEKLKLLKLLKKSFKDDDIEEAFDIELKKFLENINPTEIPDTLTSFYYTNIDLQKSSESKSKFNNDILHQSKLINYFNGDYSKSKIEKEIENFLKKIKKNKKYFFSAKDLALVESLAKDGVEIPKEFDYQEISKQYSIPSNLLKLGKSNESAFLTLKLVEIIGEDEAYNLDPETIYFITHLLNQNNLKKIRNEIIISALPQRS